MRYTGLCFLTKYDSENKVCTVAVLHEEKIIEVAEVKEAFTDEEREAILGILHQTGKAQQNQIYKVSNWKESTELLLLNTTVEFLQFLHFLGYHNLQ